MILHLLGVSMNGVFLYCFSCPQIIFQKQLSRIQWVSLVFLTFGCIIKEYGRFAGPTETEGKSSSYLDVHLLLILVQVTP